MQIPREIAVNVRVRWSAVGERKPLALGQGEEGGNLKRKVGRQNRQRRGSLIAMDILRYLSQTLLVPLIIIGKPFLRDLSVTMCTNTDQCGGFILQKVRIIIVLIWDFVINVNRLG